MKALVTKELVESLIVNRYSKHFDVSIVGSVARFGRSYNDVDILLRYNHKDEIDAFVETIMKDGWAPMSQEVIGNSATFKRFSKLVGEYDVTMDLYIAQQFSKVLA